jgi:hypothetical protein
LILFPASSGSDNARLRRLMRDLAETQLRRLLRHLAETQLRRLSRHLAKHGYAACWVTSRKPVANARGYASASTSGTSTFRRVSARLNWSALTTALPLKWLLKTTSTSSVSAARAISRVRRIHGASSFASYR